MSKAKEILNICNGLSEATIHTNPGIEKELRKLGFVIPKYPKTGEVTLDDKVVGHMDNFAGLIIKSKSALKTIQGSAIGKKIGIWNPDDTSED